MPVGRGPRRIIPIQNKRSLATEFRFIGGKLYLDRPTHKGVQWASCAAKDSVHHAQFQNMGIYHAPNTGDLVSWIGGKNPPASQPGTPLGNAPIGKPRFTRFTPSCMDDKLKQRK